MKVGIKKVVDVDLKTISVHAKVCDSGSYTLKDSDGQVVKDKDGCYVPGFFPGEHYGDYLDLEIDLETGRILNWTTPNESQLRQFVGCDEEEE